MSNPIRLQEDPGEGESDRRLASSCKAFSGTPVQWTVPSVKVSSSRRCGSLRLRAPVSERNGNAIPIPARKQLLSKNALKTDSH